MMVQAGSAQSEREPVEGRHGADVLLRLALYLLPARQSRTLLACWVAIPVALALACVVLGSGLRELRAANARAHAQVESATLLAVNGFQQQMGQDLAELKRAIQDAAVQGALPAGCPAYVREHALLGPVLVNLSVRSLSGEVICEFWGPAGLDAGTAGHFAWRHQGRWLTGLTQPIFDAAGNRLGSLILQLDLFQMSQALGALLPSPALVEVLSGKQIIVARSVDAALYIGRLSAYADQLRGLPAGSFYADEAVGEVRRLSHFVTLPGTDWRLLVGLPEADLFSQYDRLLRRTMGLGLAFTILLTWLSWRVGIALFMPSLRARTRA